MHRINRAARWLGILPALALAGCAVLRIDVDVYKGPLANHKDVQTQQLWSMAIAARPLLVELRDTVEWDDVCSRYARDSMASERKARMGAVPNSDEVENRLYNACIVANREVAKWSGWYVAGFVPPRSEKRGGDESAADSKHRNKICVEGKVSEGEAIKIKSLFDTEKGDFFNKNPEKYLKKRCEFVEYQSTRINQILNLYDDLHNYDGRSGDEARFIEKKIDAVVRGDVTSSEFHISESDEITQQEKNAKELIETADIIKKSITSGGVSQDELKKFISGVRDQWLLGIGTLSKINNFDELRKEVLQKYKDGLASSVAEATNIELISKMLYSPIEEVVNLVPVLRSDFEHKLRYAHIRGSSYWMRGRDVDWPRKDGGYSAEEIETLKYYLAYALDVETEIYTDALMAMDEIVRGKNSVVSEQVKLRIADEGQARLVAIAGLSWPGEQAAQALINSERTGEKVEPSNDNSLPSPDGASLESELTQTARKFPITVSEAQKAASTAKNFPPKVGLRGGRLSEGIDTLSEHYLIAKRNYDLQCRDVSTANHNGELGSSCDKQRTDVDGHEQVLTDALTRFAEKILTIANNDTLLRTRDSGNGNGGSIISRFGRRQLDQFVTVLQAVGNAILIQTDELRRRASFDRQQARGMSAELSEISGRFGSESTGCEKNGSRIGGNKPSAAPTSAVTELGSSSGATTNVATSDTAGEDKIGKSPVTNSSSECATDLNLVRSVAGGDNATQPRTTIEALDRLIAALRYEQIKAALSVPGEPGETCKGPKSQAAGGAETTKTGTADSGKADLPAECTRYNRISTALALAYQHRSGMVYIRPPGAYLRSNFAATNLQGDPRLSWENMLQRHWARAIPFYDVIKESQQAKELRIQEQIDKRFWQNINQVRVAGAGRTNHVLVKDDVGNWYVKGMSADPQDIFQAAQSTALFGLGGALNANLLLQRNLERDLLNANSETDRNAIRGELERVTDNNRRSAQGTGTELGSVLQDYTSRHVTEVTGEFNRLRERFTQGGFETQFGDISTSAVAQIENEADRQAVLALLNRVPADESLVAHYARDIAPQLAPVTDQNASARVYFGRIVDAAHGMLTASQIAIRAIHTANIQSAAEQGETTAAERLQAVKLEITQATDRIAVLDRQQEREKAVLDELNKAVENSGDSASDQLKQQQAAAKIALDSTQSSLENEQASLVALMNERDALTMRLTQIDAAEKRVIAATRGYFRSEVREVYRTRTDAAAQLETAANVLSGPADTGARRTPVTSP